MKTHSTTRWWSKFEVIKQVFDLFGDVEVFFSLLLIQNFLPFFMTQTKRCIWSWNLQHLCMELSYRLYRQRTDLKVMVPHYDTGAEILGGQGVLWHPHFSCCLPLALSSQSDASQPTTPIRSGMRFFAPPIAFPTHVCTRALIMAKRQQVFPSCAGLERKDETPPKLRAMLHFGHLK